MALVFNTPKSALNTTSKDIQNLSSDCPPCPEVNLTTADVEYTENGEYTVTPEEGYDGLTQVDITVNVPSVKNQDKLVVPTTSSQTITADSGYSGIGTVSVEAVTSSIDANIAAGNIKKNVSILGVTGSYDPQPILQEKTIDPATSIQGVQADAGYDGLSNVTINAVTAAIDPHIQPENILSGVTILDVTGTDAGYDAGYSEGYDAGQAACPSPTYIPLGETITQNGTYLYDPTDYDGGSYEYFSDAAITVNVSGSNCPDWSTIGWDCNDVTASGIDADLAYIAQKKADYDNLQLGSFSNEPFVFAPKIVVRQGTKFQSCARLAYVPELTLDTTSLNGFFQSCSNLRSVALFDTSNVTDMSSCFKSCSKLLSIPLFNTSNVTRMDSTFMSSILNSLPALDTSKVTTFATCFAYNSALSTIPLISGVAATTIQGMFQGCNGLTTLGGFANLGKAFTGNIALAHLLDLSPSIVLTKQSIMNIINNLAAPDDTTCTDATLKLSATSYALLDASDIAIATAKNWTVTSA